jgi:hypothetical protein
VGAKEVGRNKLDSNNWSTNIKISKSKGLPYKTIQGKFRIARSLLLHRFRCIENFPDDIH